MLATALDLVTRDLRSEDWPEVAEIFRDGARSGLATFATELPPWETWDAAHPLRVLAELDEQVVGWAALEPVSSRHVYRGVMRSSVYVAAEARGRGIGRALMEELLERSEQAGVWTVEASVFPENETSLKLHHAVGFRVVGVRHKIGKRDGLWRDTVLMERRSDVVT